MNDEADIKKTTPGQPPPSAGAARASIDSESFALICKALGHPARVKIVEHLKGREGCVCGQIVKILPLAQSTVSQHLKCLKEAGLIRGVVEGLSICYCLDHQALETFKKMASKL
ncbi:MAG: winged helix-turn-helix transcriptional regulator [Desulfobacterales bacterium]|nr:winged helix-turn-helix transcriptional regulator [Desulfobacterales bacterium]